MRVLVVIPKDIDGVLYHRLLVPFRKIAKTISVTQVHNIDNVSIDQLNRFDVVVISRLAGSDNVDANIEKMKAANTPYIFDIDDYWNLGLDHLMYGAYKEHQVSERIAKYIINASCIWTTHIGFADVIRKLNTNVVVVPNAIDIEDDQWQGSEERINDEYTFGWVGGVHHFSDLQLIRPALNRIKELDCKVALGGYSNQDEMWMMFEHWFTDYGNNNSQYIRLEARTIDTYAHIYDHIDCALIPLKDNKFNNCKSELKVIEAAMKLKPVIVSNVMPYTYICNENNSYLIDEDRGHADWFRTMKHILKNKDEASNKAIQLRQDVESIYNLNSINLKRINSIEKTLARPKN